MFLIQYSCPANKDMGKLMRFWDLLIMSMHTVKPVLNGHSRKKKTKILMTNGSVMKVKSIAECSPIKNKHNKDLDDKWQLNVGQK